MKSHDHKDTKRKEHNKKPSTHIHISLFNQNIQKPPKPEPSCFEGLKKLFSCCKPT